MITIALSTTIGADRSRVWKALTDPSEMLAWNRSLIASIRIPAEYPRPGQHARWRYRLGGIPVVMHDRILEVVEGQRLRSSMALGLFRFDLTYVLEGEKPAKGSEGERTRLGATLAASNVVPVVGGALDRFAVRRLATEIVGGALESVRKWCETAPRRKPSSKKMPRGSSPRA